MAVLGKAVVQPFTAFFSYFSSYERGTELLINWHVSASQRCARHVAPRPGDKSPSRHN